MRISCFPHRHGKCVRQTAYGVSAVLIAALTTAGISSARAETGAIINTAYVKSSVNGEIIVVASNTVSLKTAQLIDVALQASVPDDYARPGTTGHATPFVLTNTGSGDDTFSLTAGLTGDKAVLTGLWIDRDGDGEFDAAQDAPLDPATVQVAAGRSVTVFVVMDIDRTLSMEDTIGVTLTATSLTGTGPAGTVVAQSSGEAVVGLSGGTAQAQAAIVHIDRMPREPGEEDPDLSGLKLIKSQSVNTPQGRNPMAGDLITYRLEAVFPVDVTVADARLSDVIPTGTNYVGGSLTLDGAALTDAEGDDAGRFNTTSNQIEIGLGNSNAGLTRTVTFQVKIQ